MKINIFLIIVITACSTGCAGLRTRWEHNNALRRTIEATPDLQSEVKSMQFHLDGLDGVVSDISERLDSLEERVKRLEAK